MVITDCDIREFRQRAKTELKSGCDCGRMRWDDVVEALCREVERLRHESLGSVRNAAAMREALLAIKELDFNREEDCHTFYRLIDNALSAPPRNCDMPLVVDGPANNYADKAWLVFKKHNPDAYFDVYGLLRCIDWLIAPATEQKGETDGSK